MALCSKCGMEIYEEASSCPNCGKIFLEIGESKEPKRTSESKTERVVFCDGCGTKILGEVNICPNCGNPFKKGHDSKDHNVSNNKDIKSDTEQTPRWNFKVKQPVYKYAGYDPPSRYEQFLEALGRIFDG